MVLLASETKLFFMAEKNSHPTDSNSRLAKALQPIADLGESGARQYQQEARAIQSIEQKYQAVNSLYATAFQRVQTLDETVRKLRESWQDEPC